MEAEGGAVAAMAEEEEGIRKGNDTYCTDSNYYYHPVTGIGSAHQHIVCML
jgi:hypothetical protein